MPLTPNGTGSSTGTSITASNAISINGGTGVTVRPGDLVVALACENTANGTTGASDNLGNTYSAQNAGTLSTVAGRMFYSRVTVGGTLTTVTITASAAANAFSLVAAVFNNGFDATPLDANPANTTGDITTPYNGPASGALAQARELIVGWSANNANVTWTSSAPWTTAVEASQASTHAVVQYQDVSATTTQTPAFTGTAPTVNVMGTASFKQTNLMGQALL